MRRWFSSKAPVVPLDRFSQEFTSSFQQDNFEGFRLDLAKSREPFTLMGTLALGSLPTYPGYLWQCGPIYSRNGRLLALRLASDKSMTARVSQTVGSLEGRLMVEVACPKSGPAIGWEASLTKEPRPHSTLAGGLKLAMQESTMIYNASVSKRVIPGLHVGSDLTLIEGNRTSTMISGLRYDGLPGHVFAAFVSRQPDFETADVHRQAHSAKVQYWRQVSDRCKLGTELEVVSSSKGAVHSGFRLAYDHFFRNARVQGSVSSQGEVQVLAMASNGISLSGVADVLTGRYSVGLGLSGPHDS